MSKVDKEYHNLLEKILQEGYTYEDPNRKRVNRIEIPSYTFRHEFSDGFPAITTKKLNYKSVVTELIWFLRGDTNIKYLVDNGCNIWNKDAYNYYLKHKKGDLSFEEYVKYIKELPQDSGLIGFGSLGPVYGAQWRKWEYNGLGNVTWFEDQISNLIKSLKENPLSTQHIVNAWNVGDLNKMALPPCHYGFQVVVRPLSLIERYNIHTKDSYYIHMMMRDYSEEKCHSELDSKNIPKYGFELHWTQRSVDTFLGLPYNIASYATLALIFEKITGYKALAIQGDLKKVHLYDNSLDAVKEQLSRDVDKYDKCELEIDNNYNWNNLDNVLNVLSPKPENGDFVLKNYESYPHIKVEMLERDK